MTDEEIAQLAQLAASFVAHPFWQHWLQFAEQEANRRLGELRDSISTDSRVIHHLRNEWRGLEKAFDLMQRYPYSCVEAGKEAEKAIRERLITLARG